MLVRVEPGGGTREVGFYDGVGRERTCRHGAEGRPPSRRLQVQRSTRDQRAGGSSGRPTLDVGCRCFPRKKGLMKDKKKLCPDCETLQKIGERGGESFHAKVPGPGGIRQLHRAKGKCVE